MKISIDGGALVSDQNKQFGNYIFTKELLSTITRDDQKNQYYLYLQENNTLFSRLHPKVLRPKFGWLKVRISFEELLFRKDIFLALNQALPLYGARRKIAFCHGLAPIFFPDLYPDSAGKLRRQIEIMLKRANYIIVSSEAVRNSLNDIYKMEKIVSEKIKVINYGIPAGFLNSGSRFKKKKRLLFVGTHHPIKNIDFLVTMFSELLKFGSFQNYKLLLIGVRQEELQIPAQLKTKVVCLGHVRHEELPEYYNEASCLVTASHYESFNLPVLEALSQNTPVVGLMPAIIPELKPYVQLAPNKPLLFAKQVAKTVAHPPKISLNQLRRKFSWPQYVCKLTKLYRA